MLIPRPETELLVERALQLVAPSTQPLVIADIGTGSGALAVALAVHLLSAQIYATDISADALAVALSNCIRHHVAQQITLLQGNLCEPLPEPVDLLLSNPPYTVWDAIDWQVRTYEPRLALDGGREGLEVYRRLIPQAVAWLKPGASILLEIDPRQTTELITLAETIFPTAEITVTEDLAGWPRVLAIRT